MKLMFSILTSTQKGKKKSSIQKVNDTKIQTKYHTLCKGVTKELCEEPKAIIFPFKKNSFEDCLVANSSNITRSA